LNSTFDFEYVSGPRFNLFSLLRIVAVYGSYILCNIGFDWIVGFREIGVVGIRLIDFIIFVVIFTEELYVAHKRQLLSKTVREIAIHEQMENRFPKLAGLDKYTCALQKLSSAWNFTDILYTRA